MTASTDISSDVNSISMSSEAAIKTVIADVKSFFLSSSLIAALQVGIFGALDGNGRPRQELFTALGLDYDLANGVVDVLVANGYLDQDGSRLELTEKSRAIVAEHDRLKSWVSEMELSFRSSAHLPQVLKSGDVQSSALSEYWAYKSTLDAAASSEELTRPYSEVMDVSQREHSQAVLDAWDFGQYERILEVGGGYARFGMELALRWPRCQVFVLDLPSVATVASERVKQAGLDDRVFPVAADAFEDELPGGMNAVVFNRVLHDWPDSKALRLVTRARSTLSAGGHIIIAEPIDEQTSEFDASSAATRLMLLLLGGRRRAISDYQTLLGEVGCRLEQAIKTKLSLVKVLVASVRDSSR